MGFVFLAEYFSGKTHTEGLQGKRHGSWSKFKRDAQSGPQTFQVVKYSQIIALLFGSGYVSKKGSLLFGHSFFKDELPTICRGKFVKSLTEQPFKQTIIKVISNSNIQ